VDELIVKPDKITPSTRGDYIRLFYLNKFMLIYKNINGEDEAVSKRMVVRFSRKEDLSANILNSLTIIHLSNGEQLKSSDEIKTLINQMKKM
jgi:hypothetical protein